MSYPISGLHIYDCLESTNKTLWELIEKGCPPFTVVVGYQQTAGRGQWGRQWESGVGGLYLSLGLELALTVDASIQLTWSSAWGIAAVLREREIPVLIKWPNDLILDDRKLGGILIETKITQGILSKAVVGVGINWANRVPDRGINLQSFFEGSERVTIHDLDTLTGLVIEGLMRGYEVLQGEGIQGLLPRYEGLLSNIGEVITLEGQTGTIMGVASTGELRVKLHSVRSNTNPLSLTDREIRCQPGTIRLGYGQKTKT